LLTALINNPVTMKTKARLRIQHVLTLEGI